MIHRIRRLAVALLSIGFLVVAPVATANAATSHIAAAKATTAKATTATAPAAKAVAAQTNCYWISYPGSSNCDGLYPTQTTCGPGRLVKSAQIDAHYVDGSPNPLVQLYYSDSCRTTWARLDHGWAPGSGDIGCHVEVHRPSGGYAEPVDPGITYAYTRMLYDSGVVSYAYGYCDGGSWDGGAMTGTY
jgi:uncharacterized membrane protein